METTKDFQDFSAKFHLIAELGQGAFGSVWKAHHIQTGSPVAIKLDISMKSLRPEYDIYQLIRIRDLSLFSVKPIPGIYGFGKIGSIEWLAMDLLGPTIDQIFEKLGSFSVVSIMKMGIQMLKCLEFLHSCNIVHGDIKGDNFAVRENNPEQIVIFDFGLSRQKATFRKGFCGSLMFALIAAHKCEPVHPKYDLETLGYLLANYHKPLPWQDVEWPTSFPQQVKHGLKLKQQKNIFAMSPGFFELTLYLMHVTAHKSPDIVYLKKMFRKKLQEIRSKQ